MNMVLNSLLKKHCEEFNLTGSEADNFEHFINYTVVKNHVAQSFDPSVICTQKGEVAIDGIAIIAEGNLVTSTQEIEDIFALKKKEITVDFIFIQSKTSEKFDAAEISLFFDAVKSFFDDSSKINNTQQLQKFKRIIRFIFNNCEKLYT